MEIFKCAVVAPVTDQERVQDKVIVCGTWSVEGHWSRKTIRILQGIVAMVPGTAVLQDFEDVGKSVCRCDWALGDSVDSVHWHCMKLTNTMPMDGGSVVLQLVCHSDLQGVAPAGLNPGSGIHCVETFTLGLVEAVGIDDTFIDDEGNLPGLANGGGVFVVRVDIEKLAWIAGVVHVTEPFTARIGVVYPTFHSRVVTYKVWPTVGWGEDGSTRKLGIEGWGAVGCSTRCLSFGGFWPVNIDGKWCS